MPFSPVQSARKFVRVFISPCASSSLNTSLPAQSGDGGVKRISKELCRGQRKKPMWSRVHRRKTGSMYIEFLQHVLLLF